MMLQDLRHAIRMSMRDPGFAAATVLRMGIGSNTASFSGINTVLLKPLPYPYSEGLLKVWKHFIGIGLPNDQNWISQEFRRLRSDEL